MSLQGRENHVTNGGDYADEPFAYEARRRRVRATHLLIRRSDMEPTTFGNAVVEFRRNSYIHSSRSRGFGFDNGGWVRVQRLHVA